MAALAQIRCNHPNLPVLMITGGHSEALALWALRIRVWDLLVKPVSNSELSQRLTALIELTRQPGRGPARAIQFPRQVNEATAIPKSPGRRSRTHPAIAHEATHFDRKIALQDVAALCRLSPTQFCRVFRQEQAQASDSLCCTTGWSRRAKASPIQAHWPRKSPTPSASTISRISRGRSNASSA